MSWKNIQDKEPAEGDGAENAKGDYTKKNVETAKKHLLESDDLLQQLQGKFSKLLSSEVFIMIFMYRPYC